MVASQNLDKYLCLMILVHGVIEIFPVSQWQSIIIQCPQLLVLAHEHVQLTFSNHQSYADLRISVGNEASMVFCIEWFQLTGERRSQWSTLIVQ
jgi:hypothetical protein